ncbi:MAG: DUF4301 family protein [Desulfuromonadales bacterium]|nr:DUF4301 family protein [Desulfuromonadales bacterium]
MALSDDDKQQLVERGIPLSRFNKQLEQLRAGAAWLKLERPCTPNDGILQIDPAEHPSLIKHFTEAIAAGRLTRFIPASGAATRMFKPLYQAQADNLRLFVERLRDFAFYSELEKCLDETGFEIERLINDEDVDKIIGALLERQGLGYALLPKALLAFHVVADGLRTPFIEHQAEAALLSGLDSTVSLHFTVSPEHLPLFNAQAAAWRETLHSTYGCDFDLTYSTQHACTNTPALDDEQLLRSADGKLQLRHGGHGALIENLHALDADIVLIRNIDNVVPDARKADNLLWGRIMIGYLAQLQQEQFAILKALHDQPDDPLARDLAFSFLCDRLQLNVPFDLDSESLRDLLDRPLRVCGMVPNSGEPGGGPFWVKDAKGKVSRQIVEGSQVNVKDTKQADILAQATHFNPVDLVCGLRDWRGQAYDLSRFVDDEAVIISNKTLAGRKLRTLELPGLWNGAMAGWHSVFVEIPPQCFNPVKTVFDLLRPAHIAD